MSGKPYQIQNGSMTLYVDMKYEGTTFEFSGFTIDGDESFYQPCIGVRDSDLAQGRPRVDLNQYLFDKFKALADEELKEYLNRHISDMTIHDPSRDTCALVWHIAGQEPAIRFQKSVQCKYVIDGIVGIEINHTVCFYDFASNEIAGYRNAWNAYEDKPLNTTPMRVFYGEYLDRLLALEQYKRGLAPPYYVELAKLNRFLDGKKSVKLVMKNGAVHEYKHHYGYEVYLRALLSFHPENAAPFSLEDNYDLKPRFSGNRPVDELDYLQYGREKHYIDPAVLKQFSVSER